MTGTAHDLQPAAVDASMIDDELFAEASAWHFRLQADDVSAADRRDFAAWLAGSEARARAWSEVQTLLGALQRPARAAHAAERWPARRGAWRGWACAAALLLGLGVTLMQSPWLDRLRADQATAVGESRTLDLADGSRVQLNTDSAVQVELGEHERRVRLLRGEAFFEVTHAPERPFLVESGAGWVKVVGTRFSVDRREGETRVRVESGRVEVNGGSRQAVLLEHGQGVEFGAAGLGAAHGIDPLQAFAWRQRQLVFRQQPLGEVVAELNRYWPGRTFVVGEALERRVVSGVFEIDKPDAVLKALHLTLGLDVQRFTPYLTLLREGQAQQP
ncbi:FecR family protein [Pseudomonas solani]|uniref:FecR family protein n=1 Tax=Pseudomonas solani TaxID=2731552 RepID=UPI003C2C3F78